MPSALIRRRFARVPLRRSDVATFAGAFVGLTAIWYLLGRAILASRSTVDTDAAIARWFVRHRTSDLNRWTAFGSALSDTTIKTVLTSVAALLVAWICRRWREPLMLILSLVLEASVFIVVTWMVGRDRPNVDQFENSPVESSFPSGHAAAAVVYFAFVIVVFWHTRRTWIRVVASVAVAAVALAVGISRMYRGMHFFSDVVAGYALGAASLVVCWRLLKQFDHASCSE